MKSFMIRVLRVVLDIRIINSRRPRWTGIWLAREKTVMRIGLRWGNRKEGDFLEDLDVDGRIIFKEVFNPFQPSDAMWRHTFHLSLI
jgi:hypothetical protein